MGKILKFGEFKESIFLDYAIPAMLALPIIRIIFKSILNNFRGSKFIMSLQKMENFKILLSMYEDEKGISMVCEDEKKNRMFVALKNKTIYFKFVINGKTENIKCKLVDEIYKGLYSTMQGKKVQYDKAVEEMMKKKETKNESFVGTGIAVLVAVPIVREIYKFLMYRYSKKKINKLFDRMVDFVYLVDFKQDGNVTSMTYTDDQENRSNDTVNMIFDSETKMAGFYFDIDGEKNSVEYQVRDSEYLNIMNMIEAAKIEMDKYEEEMKKKT